MSYCTIFSCNFHREKQDLKGSIAFNENVPVSDQFWCRLLIIIQEL